MSRILFTGFGQIPGISDLQTTIESQIMWGAWEVNRTFIVPTFLDDGALDIGHIGETTRLRPGLMLSFDTTTKKAKHWLTGEIIYGFLLWDNLSGVDTTGVVATAGKWFGYALIRGQIKENAIFGSEVGDEAGSQPGNIRGIGVTTTAVPDALLAQGFLIDTFTEDLAVVSTA